MKKHLILSIGLLLSLEAISQDGPFSFNGKTTIFTGNALHWDAAQDATTNLILSSWSDRYIKINGATFRQNGYLGIGTTSPNVMLEVAGLGRFTGPNGFSIGGDGNQLRIQTSTDIPNHAFGFLNAGNSFEGIRVKQVSVGGNFADLYAAPLNGMIIEGNLGVGTNSPAFKLDVAGTLRTTSFISGRDYITVDNGNSGGSYRVALNGQSDGYVTGRNASSQDMFLISANGNSYLNGGNIGIGTTTPGAKLEVIQSNAEEPAIKVSDLIVVPQLLNGSWNSIAKSGDMGIISKNGRALVIAPHQSAVSGLRITADGNVGIGTPLDSNPNNYRLAVNGKIGAKEVMVEISSTTWPDYVFEPNYKLPTLSELEQYIKTNKHLPEVPTAEQVKENGLSVGEMNAILLKKVEELTLHLIEQGKKVEEQNKKIDDQNLIIIQQNDRLTKLEKSN